MVEANTVPEMLAVPLRLSRIFMPYAMRQRDAAHQRQGISDPISGGLRFAHYTSAEAALKILTSKRIWMRNATCMADYGEVLHGWQILLAYFDKPRTDEFVAALDASVPGAAREAISLFNGWQQNGLNLNIFVASLSEHDQSEDRHGRLSMWRAFGTSSTTRVAIVIKVPGYSGGAEMLGIQFSPVAYLPEEEVHAVIHEVTENAKRDAEFLRTIDKQAITAWLFNMFFVGVACLKHRGFHEEREWRGIYAPQISKSSMIEQSIEVVGGVPQHVQKLPLDRHVSPELAGIDLHAMLDRVIIGPSPYPWVLYQSFVHTLRDAGIADAENKVIVSDIPIRS
ncbi:MAG TPA: hypothetical protein VGF97_11560 [Rhizomicrobium sp.]|jgi:hypothetical protein